MEKCRSCGKTHRGTCKRSTWKYKVGKVKGGYGETDFNKKVIKIDKSKHRKNYKRLTPNPDGSENMLTTITHEMVHKRFPKKSEKATEKLARAMKSKMSPKTKQKMYAKFS